MYGFNIYVFIQQCFILFGLLLLELQELIQSIWAPTRVKARSKCLRKRFLKGNWGKYGRRCYFSH